MTLLPRFAIDRLAVHVATDGWQATGFRSGRLQIETATKQQQSFDLEADAVVSSLEEAMRESAEIAKLVARYRLDPSLYVTVNGITTPIRAEARWLVELTVAARRGDREEQRRLLAAEVTRARAVCPDGCELATRMNHATDKNPIYLAYLDQVLSTGTPDVFTPVAQTRFLAVPRRLFAAMRAARSAHEFSQRASVGFGAAAFAP